MFSKRQERPQRCATVWSTKLCHNENAIELVRHAIADDPYYSIIEITEICYLSHGTIHRIIHEELDKKKVCAKRVPHFLTGAHTKCRECDMC